METLFENKWCKIVSKGTIYVVKSKANKYNDAYFLTANEAYRYIGVIPKTESHDHKPVR